MSLAVLFRIDQSSFESRLQNWVKSAADESEKNRLEAQCTILDAKKNKAKNLDLSFLDLTDVPPLDDLTQLEKLNLSYNQLEALPKGYFTGLNKLRELDLRNNQLSTLPEGCSNELNCLRILYLDGNQLNTLPEGCFKELNLLEELGLDDNKLRTVEPNCFSGLNSLGILFG